MPGCNPLSSRNANLQFQNWSVGSWKLRRCPDSQPDPPSCHTPDHGRRNASRTPSWWHAVAGRLHAPGVRWMAPARVDDGPRQHPAPGVAAGTAHCSDGPRRAALRRCAAVASLLQGDEAVSRRVSGRRTHGCVPANLAPDAGSADSTQLLERPQTSTGVYHVAI